LSPLHVLNQYESQGVVLFLHAEETEGQK
jgi:hypothetical protein